MLQTLKSEDLFCKRDHSSPRSVTKWPCGQLASFFHRWKMTLEFESFGVFRVVEQLQQKKLAHFTLFYCLYFRSKLGTWWPGTGWFNKPENTVPFIIWNTRNFKPEFLVEWKAPLDCSQSPISPRESIVKGVVVVREGAALLYSPQFRSHQETKMAACRTQWSTSTISRKNRRLWAV